MRVLAVLGLVACLAGAVSAQEAPAKPLPQGKEFTLDNGLQVWLHPVSRATHAAVVVVFDVGELHDPEGQSGLAHLVEHCYVTCAAGDRPARTYQQWIEGGRTCNAQTGRDYTVVAEVVPKERVLEALREQADRMGALKITDADLARELPRLAFELSNMFEAFPQLAARNLGAEVVNPSPPGSRKGGVLEQVQQLTAEQVQARWAAVYRPGRARLMVAGAFDDRGVRAVVAERFGAIPGVEVALAARTPAPVPASMRVVREVTPRQPGIAGAAALVVRAPGPDDPHLAPFMVAMQRLWQQQWLLRRRDLEAQWSPLDDPAVAALVTLIAPGEAPAAAVARLEKLLADAFAGEVGAEAREFTRSQFARIYGTGSMPMPHLEQNLYAAAFRHARLLQLGINPGELTRRLNGVVTPTFEAMRAAVFAPEKRATVIVTVKP